MFSRFRTNVNGRVTNRSFGLFGLFFGLFKLVLILILIVVALVWYIIAKPGTKSEGVTTFEQCQKTENAKTQASYPEVCRTPDGKSFTNPSQITEPK